MATGIAILIDFVKGAVWDAIHGTGFLGNLPAELLAVGSQENEETVLMSLRVEKLGKTLLPNLKIDNETLLYPAISLPETSGHHLTAVAGVSQPRRDAEPFCHFPACWMTQSVQHA
mgnify:FL=1